VYGQECLITNAWCVTLPALSSFGRIARSPTSGGEGRFALPVTARAGSTCETLEIFKNNFINGDFT